VPAAAGSTAFAEDGGLMSYGSKVPANFRRAAIFVDKILKGAKPGDLPVEQPEKFELVINLKSMTPSASTRAKRSSQSNRAVLRTRSAARGYGTRRPRAVH
jgi:ABC-type uncharacterized transport system substrate-binding protein